MWAGEKKVVRRYDVPSWILARFISYPLLSELVHIASRCFSLREWICKMPLEIYVFSSRRSHASIAPSLIYLVICQGKRIRGPIRQFLSLLDRFHRL
jgi:hypothetical protein